MTGKKFLVTAGPTFEPIDPVRFIGNFSSGKMGYALAESLASHGAEVVLISGPTALKTSSQLVRLIKIRTAEEMQRECLSCFSQMDGAILAAAVADYRPKNRAMKKIKRNNDDLLLELTANPDIAEALGKRKTDHQILAGFALETNDAVENARKKMKKKNFDFIVLNSLQDKGAGFNFDTNRISILGKHNRILDFPLKSKQDVAEDIVNYLQTLL